MQRRKDVDKIYLKFGYHPDFSNALKTYCGAKWYADTKEWGFEDRFEDKSNDLLLRYYGFSYRSDEKIRVEFNFVDFYDTTSGSVKIANLPIVWRESRDSEVCFRTHTVLLSGDFPKSGGSVNHPRIFNVSSDIDESIRLETVLYKEFYATLSSLDKSKLVITKELTNQPDKNALLAKKQELLNQIAKIDEQLRHL